MYISLIYLSSCSLDIIMGLFIANAWGRIGKIRSTAGEERMTECVWDDAESWGGAPRDGRESVWVCARRLRGRDAKFRCSSLQRLIEYRAYCEGTFRTTIHTYTHTHTRTHLTSRSVMVAVYTICEPSRSEMGVLLLLDNEGQVVRGVAEHLMTLLGEGDLGALLPPLLHLYVEHTLFWSQRVFVRLPEACQFHTLRHAH